MEISGFAIYNYPSILYRVSKTDSECWLPIKNYFTIINYDKLFYFYVHLYVTVSIRKIHNLILNKDPSKQFNNINNMYITIIYKLW